MARTITMDFRRGGGSDILFGTVTVYGTEPAPHGSGWVVTSETTLPLVNGQATLPDALERPVGGGSHYHAIARDLNSGAGATFRFYLPPGTSPVNVVNLPSAW